MSSSPSPQTCRRLLHLSLATRKAWKKTPLLDPLLSRHYHRSKYPRSTKPASFRQLQNVSVFSTSFQLPSQPQMTPTSLKANSASLISKALRSLQHCHMFGGLMRASRISSSAMIINSNSQATVIRLCGTYGKSLGRSRYGSMRYALIKMTYRKSHNRSR